MIGALNKYIYDYTKCVDSCQPYLQSRTDRLGTSTYLCLMKCNNFYSNLRTNHLPSVGAMYINQRLVPTKIYEYEADTKRDLRKINEKYNMDMCKHQCKLDSKFMSEYEANLCQEKCNKMVSWWRK